LAADRLPWPERHDFSETSACLVRGQVRRLQARPDARILERGLPDGIGEVAFNLLEQLLDAAPKLVLVVEDEFDPLVTPGNPG